MLDHGKVIMVNDQLIPKSQPLRWQWSRDSLWEHGQTKELVPCFAALMFLPCCPVLKHVFWDMEWHGYLLPKITKRGSKAGEKTVVDFSDQTPWFWWSFDGSPALAPPSVASNLSWRKTNRRKEKEKGRLDPEGRSSSFLLRFAIGMIFPTQAPIWNCWWMTTWLYLTQYVLTVVYIQLNHCCRML